MSALWLGYPKWHSNGIVSGPLRLLSEELMKNIRVPHSCGEQPLEASHVVKMGHHVPSHWTGKSTLGNHLPNKILKIDHYWYLWYLGYILHTHMIYPKLSKYQNMSTWLLKMTKIISKPAVSFNVRPNQPLLLHQPQGGSPVSWGTPSSWGPPMTCTYDHHMS